jgi:hypothetical protein
VEGLQEGCGVKALCDSFGEMGSDWANIEREATTGNIDHTAKKRQEADMTETFSICYIE